MLVAVIADGVAMLFMPRSSIMTEKLARRGLRVHQDYEADVLTQATVGETMEKDAPVIAAGTRRWEKWRSALHAMIRRWRGMRRY